MKLELISKNSHPEIWDNMDDSTKYPKSELSYFRCDYDGYRWWNTIWPIHKELYFHELGKEFDDLYASLNKTFPNLEALRAFCADSAEATGDPDEFNVYIDMKYGYYWIRMITREKDYNMYIHCYCKEPEEKSEAAGDE